MKRVQSIILVLSMFMLIFSAMGSAEQNTEWTVLEPLGDLSKAQMYTAPKTAGTLSGKTAYFSYMAYGMDRMANFNFMTNGTASNGNDFTANPQKVELVEEGGKHAVHIDSPVSGSAVNLYMPVIKFDSIYRNDYRYKLEFKAKRSDKEAVSGTVNFVSCVRFMNDSGKKLKDIPIPSIGVSADYKDYQLEISPSEIPAEAVQMTGLFYLPSSNAVRDVYLCDFKWSVEKISKVTVNTSGDGSIECPKVFSVKSGSKASVKIIPNEGNDIEYIKLNGIPVWTYVKDPFIYETPELTEDAVIDVSFKESRPEQDIQAFKAVFTDKSTRPYAVVFGTAKASASNPLIKWGMLVSSKELSLDEFILNGEGVFEARALNEKKNYLGQYGIRIIGNDLLSGKTYYSRAYGVYKDGSVLYAEQIIPFTIPE